MSSKSSAVKVKKNAAKPRGKSSAYNFYVKSCKSEEPSSKSNPGGDKTNGQDLLKRCSEEWKKMTEKQKEEFKALAEKDKERFEKEMAVFDPSSVDKTDKKRKRSSTEKDPNAPKRPMGAFFLFSNERREEVKKSNPELKGTDVSKQLGSLWKELTQTDKDKYQNEANKARDIYLVELEKYNALKGETAETGEEDKENESSPANDSA